MSVVVKSLVQSVVGVYSVTLVQSVVVGVDVSIVIFFFQEWLLVVFQRLFRVLFPTVGPGKESRCL